MEYNSLEYLQKIVEALDKATERWSRIAKGESTDYLSTRELCSLINHEKCRGCPIKNSTGESQCVNSPISDWIFHHGCKHIKEMVASVRYDIFKPMGLRVHCEKCKDRANDVHKNLLNLLQKYRKKLKNKYKNQEKWVIL